MQDKTCEKFKVLYSRSLDNALQDREGKMFVKDHLSKCRYCKVFSQAINKDHMLINALLKVKPLSLNFDERLIALISESDTENPENAVEYPESVSETTDNVIKNPEQLPETTENVSETTEKLPETIEEPTESTNKIPETNVPKENKEVAVEYELHEIESPDDAEGQLSMFGDLSLIDEVASKEKVAVSKKTPKKKKFVDESIQIDLFAEPIEEPKQTESDEKIQEETDEIISLKPIETETNIEQETTSDELKETVILEESKEENDEIISLEPIETETNIEQKTTSDELKETVILKESKVEEIVEENPVAEEPQEEIEEVKDAFAPVDDDVEPEVVQEAISEKIEPLPVSHKLSVQEEEAKDKQKEDEGTIEVQESDDKVVSDEESVSSLDNVWKIVSNKRAKKLGRTFVKASIGYIPVKKSSLIEEYRLSLSYISSILTMILMLLLMSIG